MCINVGVFVMVDENTNNDDDGVIDDVVTMGDEEPRPIEEILAEIEAYIGVPITPVQRTYISRDFNDDVIRFAPFPCAQLCKVYFDGEEYTDFLESDLEAGLIYLNQKLKHRILKVEYMWGLTEDMKTRIVMPFAKELQNLEMSGWSWQKGSITRTEGSVSMTETESNGGINLLMKKLDALKARFAVRSELI